MVFCGIAGNDAGTGGFTGIIPTGLALLSAVWGSASLETQSIS